MSDSCIQSSVNAISCLVHVHMHSAVVCSVYCVEWARSDLKVDAFINTHHHMILSISWALHILRWYLNLAVILNPLHSSLASMNDIYRIAPNSWHTHNVLLCTFWIIYTYRILIYLVAGDGIYWFCCFFVFLLCVCVCCLGEFILSIPYIQQLIYKLCVTQTNRKTNFAYNILVCNMNEWQFSIRRIGWLVPFFSQISSPYIYEQVHSWIRLSYRLFLFLCMSVICFLFSNSFALSIQLIFYFSFVWTLCKQTISRRCHTQKKTP